MANTKWVKPRNSKNNAVAAPAVPDQELDTDDDILMPNDHEADAAEEQEDEVLGDEGDTEDSYHEPEEADDELTQLSRVAGVVKRQQANVPAKPGVDLDGGDDGEETEASDEDDPDDSANAPHALTEDQQRTHAVATINRNWGFSSIRQCIPEKTWLTRRLKNHEDKDWELDTIEEFEGLSEETKGQGDVMKQQIALFWHKRGRVGDDRAIGGNAEEKEKNLRDDLQRLRRGDRIDVDTHREKLGTSGGAGAASGPKKKRARPQSSANSARRDKSDLGRASKDRPSKRKSDAMADVDDDSGDQDDGDQGGGKSSKKPKKTGKQLAEKQKASKKDNISGRGQQQASGPDSPLRSDIRTLQQRRDALNLIRQNWGIDSLREFLPQRWHGVGEDTDDHIDRTILERIRDLSNITNTPEQGEAVSQALHDSMTPRTDTSLESILAVIAMAGEQFYAAAEVTNRNAVEAGDVTRDSSMVVAGERNRGVAQQSMRDAPQQGAASTAQLGQSSTSRRTSGLSMLRDSLTQLERQRGSRLEDMETSSDPRVLLRAARIDATRADRDVVGHMLRYEDAVLRSAAMHREIERLENIIAQEERYAEGESDGEDDGEEE